MMVKLFLVEDEIVMRDGIKRQINWEKEDIEFVGEASDGELAWPMILETKPDILLTDIHPDSDKFYDFIADVDLFPYEFISVEDGLKEEIAEKYQIKHDQYYIDITDGKIDKMEGITRFREEMGLTDSKANYVVPGVDGDVLRFYNTSDLFPLKKANYEGIDVFIPNNPKGLLKTRYGGNIMKMPQVIGVHDKLKEFSKIDNINEIYEKAIDEMREANKNFKN